MAGFRHICFDVALNGGSFCSVEYISNIDGDIFSDLDCENQDCLIESQPRYFCRVCASVAYAKTVHFEQRWRNRKYHICTANLYLWMQGNLLNDIGIWVVRREEIELIKNFFSYVLF